jgi:pimeloyl-ACP methyl ester carboxylesterase
MPYADAAGIRIYYETHGPTPGDAPAIVFAHGAGGNHLSWWQQVPHFSDRFTCVVFDHRGFGQSPDADGGPAGAAFVDDLRALLDHLGIGRATLVAQSMGGWTCLGFAVRYPERVERLMMCDTHGGMRSEALDPLWRDALRAMRPLVGEIHPAAGERMHREQPALHFLYQEIAALSPADAAPKAIMAAPTAHADQAATLPMPILFIVGEEDVVIPPPLIESATAHIPGARIERVPQAGHSVYFERPDAFNAILERFISDS